MRDSDPRPMPPSVTAAYRNPVDLLGLLSSRAYSNDARRIVLENLLAALIGDFGNVHLPHGQKQTRTITQRASALKDPIRAIELVLSVEDYGGKAETLPYLARAMEPHWRQWWDSMEWIYPGDMHLCWRQVCLNIIGQRQYAWIAAQQARSVIDLAPRSELDVAIESIEAAEAWAREPVKENKLRAEQAFVATPTFVIYNGYGTASSAAYYAVSVALCRADQDAYSQNAANAARTAFYAKSDAAAAAGVTTSQWRGFCELTKKLITPSLLDAR